MLARTKKSLQQIAGFTLLEMLVVMALIALLAGIAAPIYFGRADSARVKKAETDFSIIATALSLYKLDNAMLPTSEQGLQALVSKPRLPPLPPRYKADGYLRALPLDPWGRPYHYLAPSRDGERAFEIGTFGADGKQGGKGQDADLHD